MAAKKFGNNLGKIILIQSVSNYFLLCLAFSLSLLTTPTSHEAF